MQIERLTETEERILTALATYRFLTPQQMVFAGVSHSRRHLYATLTTLARRSPKLTSELDFGVLPGKGRLSRIYHLTPAGAELLEGEGRGEATAPARVRLFNSDYFHRLNCVDFHLTLRTWAELHGATIDYFHTYFDHSEKRTSRGGIQPRTRIAAASGAIVPDAVFAFTTADGAQRLCAFEMYNGVRTARVEQQLADYLPVLEHGAIEDAYAYEHAVRILAVFDTSAGETLARTRLASRADFRTFAPSFFFKTLEEARVDPIANWQQLHTEEPVPLFR